MYTRPILALFLLVMAAGCSTPPQPVEPVQNASASQQYLSFSIVTQEFAYQPEAITTINHIIDIHEQYAVPLDVIVDDASMQLYAEQAPNVIERLKNSSVVAVSYHTRPPTPYYQKFDFAGLGDLSTDDLYNRILAYEEHGTDLVTGEPTDHAGGYQFVKDQIGYAPIMVGMITESAFAPTLLKIYSEKGAQFVIEHRDEPIEPGQYRDALMIRPETIPLIFTEHLTDTPERFIAEQFANAPTVEGSTFMSIKTHDNDFFATQSAWLSVYHNQLGRGTPQPPFDLSVHDLQTDLLDGSEQAARWNQYESLVRYASEQRSELNLINAKQLESVITSVTAEPIVPEENPIYLTIVSHNEEPASGRYPDFVNDEAAFWEDRAAILQFATAVTEAGAAYDWQSDWNFLQAVAKYDHGTDDTNGKNIVQFLKEDLGVAIDPHAHETRYNYADVAYLIEQLGVEPSGVVGGYLVYPVAASKLEYLWEPITSTLDSTYQWQAELLWGGGSPSHTNDYNVSGMWRPSSAEQYLESSETAPLPNIGGYLGTWDGVADLLAKQEAGELESGKMYTATVMVDQDEMNAETIASTIAQIQAYQDEVASGTIQWINLADALEIWQTQYYSDPNIYSADPVITSGSEEKKLIPGNARKILPNQTGQNSCGDGVCTPFEQKSQACSLDC